MPRRLSTPLVKPMIRLGVNIDHVATLRQARRESFPDPVAAALEAVQGGADGITAHLREDRRHIQDSDIVRLKKELSVPLNMEMALSPDILKVALNVRPAWVCLVPEKRQELTTEGGLNLKFNQASLRKAISRLHEKGISVSLFVSPTLESMQLSHELNADAVELHTGSYAQYWGTSKLKKIQISIQASARLASELGLTVNAGHGLDYDNVRPLGKLHAFNEYNIGFAIVAHAVSVGLKQAVKTMKKEINS